jgi:AhpC/TSA family
LRDKMATFVNNALANSSNNNDTENRMERIQKGLLGIAIALSFFVSTSGLSLALEVGQKAPDFELDSSKGGKLKLSDLKGKNVLINFYVLDFSPT